jgi:hypothetical protein
MEGPIDFGNLMAALQYLPDREKIVLVALINAQAVPETGDPAKIERLIGQIVIAAARDKRRHAQPEGQSAPEAAAPISNVRP